jgi:hypothetical protein
MGKVKASAPRDVKGSVNEIVIFSAATLVRPVEGSGKPRSLKYDILID